VADGTPKIPPTFSWLLKGLTAADHIALTGIGDDQKAFTRFVANELLPVLT
jgi:hypothetical protein